MTTPSSNTVYSKLPQTVTDSSHNSNQKMSYANEGLSAHAIMINVNVIGFSALLVYMIVSGSLLNTIQVSIENPHLLFYLTCVGLCLSTAVLAYTKLIKSSGSVIAVAVSTLRKVTTVMLSYIVFPKPINQIHLVSGVCVLIGIIISSFCKNRKRRNE